MAHVCHPPAAIAVTPLIPVTATGTPLVVDDPSPSCPTSFVPQQLTEPLDRRAHVCHAPAEIAVALLIPVTATGTPLDIVVPSPSPS
jgi:hypothetical protein